MINVNAKNKGSVGCIKSISKCATRLKEPINNKAQNDSESNQNHILIFLKIKLNK